VTHIEACRFAQENDLLFIETSAMTGEGVDEAFGHLGKRIVHGIKQGMIPVEEDHAYDVDMDEAGPRRCIC